MVDLKGYRSWVQGEEGRPPSVFQLFNAIIVLRWLSLAVTSLGYARNLATHELDYGRFVPAVAIAVAYTLILTLLARRIYELRTRNSAFLLVDYAVSFAILCLAPGVWTPLFIFVLCSAMMAGLHGTRTSGILGAIALSVLYVSSLAVRGFTFEALVASDGVALVIVYNLEIMIFSVVWAYAAGLITRFNAAVKRAAEARDEVARANAHLDHHQKELLALHDIREAVLNVLDVDEILRIVLDSVAKMGFRGVRIDLDGHEKLAGPSDESVPITAGSERLGELVVESPEGGFDAEQQQLLWAFADQIALAVQHVRLFEQGREFAVADERNRIAVEIHDDVIQKVYGANLLAESLAPDEFAPAADAGLGKLQEGIRRGLRDLRVAVLNWDSLGWDLSLSETVGRYLEEFGELSGLRVVLCSYGAERRIGGAKRKDLLAILQEALSNAWHHARAESVTVALAFEAEDVCLSVRDDGSGFDTEADRDRWVGLKSIHERAERHGAQVRLASSMGNGTQVQVAMPW